MDPKKPKPDPQQDILQGHGAFGVEYVPKHKRAVLVQGRIHAGRRSDFESGHAKAFALDRFSIALFRVGDEFYAIKDACPHADFPLSKSKLEKNYVVVCASHNWRFDIRDGHCVKVGCGAHPDHDLGVRTFPVEIEGEEIWIRVQAP